LVKELWRIRGLNYIHDSLWKDFSALRNFVNMEEIGSNKDIGSKVGGKDNDSVSEVDLRSLWIA
jgi:hypothetical protein